MEDRNPFLTLLCFAFLREIQTVHKAQLMLWKGGKMASCYLLSSKWKWGEPGVPLGGNEKWNRQEGAAVFQTIADSNLRTGNPPQPDPFLKKAVASLLTERSCRQPQLGSDWRANFRLNQSVAIKNLPGVTYLGQMVSPCPIVFSCLSPAVGIPLIAETFVYRA